MVVWRKWTNSLVLHLRVETMINFMSTNWFNGTMSAPTSATLHWSYTASRKQDDKSF